MKKLMFIGLIIINTSIFAKGFESFGDYISTRKGISEIQIYKDDDIYLRLHNTQKTKLFEAKEPIIIKCMDDNHNDCNSIEIYNYIHNTHIDAFIFDKTKDIIDYFKKHNQVFISRKQFNDGKISYANALFECKGFTKTYTTLTK